MKTNGSTATVAARRRELGRGWPRFLLWLSLWSERRALRLLDQRMLADLGLSPADVRQETARPPWDVPAARRRRR